MGGVQVQIRPESSIYTIVRIAIVFMCLDQATLLGGVRQPDRGRVQEADNGGGKTF